MAMFALVHAKSDKSIVIKRVWRNRIESGKLRYLNEHIGFHVDVIGFLHGRKK
jgi:hypothetical protein